MLLLEPRIKIQHCRKANWNQATEVKLYKRMRRHE